MFRHKQKDRIAASSQKRFTKTLCAFKEQLSAQQLLLSPSFTPARTGCALCHSGTCPSSCMDFPTTKREIYLSLVIVKEKKKKNHQPSAQWHSTSSFWARTEIKESNYMCKLSLWNSKRSAVATLENTISLHRFYGAVQRCAPVWVFCVSSLSLSAFIYLTIKSPLRLRFVYKWFPAQKAIKCQIY